MKRSPLRRKTPLRRSGITPNYAKVLAGIDEWRAVREAILERDGYRCQRCHTGNDLHVHHRLRRSQGGKDDPGLLVTLCSACHQRVHEHPEESYAAGWLVRSGGQGLPPVG